MEDGVASRTAVLVCQGRAVADGRIAVGRFDDPTAALMLRDDERRAVEVARAGVAPKPAGPRLEYEMMVANGAVMVPRTVAIDDAVRDVDNPQLVILGAGLDGRAWRMDELTHVDVFEVDHPASQLDKRDRIGDRPPAARAVRFVPVDFARDDLGDELAGAGHRIATPTTWVCEGVVPYLTPSDVDATFGVVSRLSAPGSRLIVNYQSPSMRATVGRVIARLMTLVFQRPDPFEHEPWRSVWQPGELRTLLERHGWTVVTDDDLLTLSARLGLSTTPKRSLSSGRVCVADRRAAA